MAKTLVLSTWAWFRTFANLVFISFLWEQHRFGLSVVERSMATWLQLRSLVSQQLLVTPVLIS